MDEKAGVEITEQDGVAVMAFKATSISNPEGIAVATEQIRNFIVDKHPKGVVFDFSRVKFFSSQVLGVLLDMRKKMAAYDGKVVISGIDPQLHRVFRITNLDKIFEFFPNKQAAVEKMMAN